MEISGIFWHKLPVFHWRHVVAVLFLLCLFSGHPAWAAQKTVLVLGDSLSAGYGLEKGTGWVDLLGKRLKKDYPEITIVNASISGDTSSGGRARVPALLKRYAPTVVVIELGANDGLRGFPVKSIYDNLLAMVEMVKKQKGTVLLLGMQITPNYGQAYTRDFAGVYSALAKKGKVSLVPFFLKGVAERDDLFQSDNIHPVAEAQPVMLDNVWPFLEPLLK